LHSKHAKFQENMASQAAAPLAILNTAIAHAEYNPLRYEDNWVCPCCASRAFGPFRFHEVRICSECGYGEIWPLCFWCCERLVPAVCVGEDPAETWYSLEWADKVDVSAGAVAVRQSEMFERILQRGIDGMWTGCPKCGCVRNAVWFIRVKKREEAS
jgi:hypothetical protein